MSSRRFARGSAVGNFITLLLLVGVVALGAWLWLGKKEEPKTAGDSQKTSTSQPARDNAVAAPAGDAPSPIEPVIGTPTLEAANTFVPKDNILRIDISEYAGYGGLIVANGGLDPNAGSFFFKE
jgi:NitT/TauT family transport system substrate-binding protein